MSSSVGPFAYHTEFLARPQQVNAWWTDDLVRSVVLEPLRRDKELAKATHVAYDLADGVPIRSLDELFENSKTWRSSDYSVVAIYCGEFTKPTWKLHLRFGTSGPRVGAQVGDDASGEFRRRFRSWVAEWSRGFERAGCDLGIGYMQPLRKPYPRPRPPREGRVWPLGTLDLYLGRRWHATTEETQQVLQRICEAAIAAGIHRSVEDDVVSVAFDCDLRDEKSVASARRLAEQWLTPLVPTNPEHGWNEYGDKLLVPGTPVDRVPFTFYDEDEKVGYWAISPDPDDGSVDESRWEHLAAIARKAVLDDGTPVTAVRLIAPTREVALALRTRAAEAGFDMVTYPQGHGGFWRVCSDDKDAAALQSQNS
jgi:hypothetical protein